MEFTEVLSKRRSVRAFLKKAVEEERLECILASAMLAPTSWSTKAWEFIVVKEPTMKAALSEASAHAGFVKDAPLVIIVCYNIKIGRRFREDSSICASHILLEAVNQGLASCFVQVADAGEPQGHAEPYVKRLLGIPEEMRVQCMLPIGYPKRELNPHKKNEFDRSKIHPERF